MKDVLIISNYWHFENEKSSSRYLHIANMLAAEKEVKVEVVTSNFYHTSKSHRVDNPPKEENYSYDTTLLYERGYKKNISIKRLISHKDFANNVKKYLKKRKKPDVIYCFVPPLGLSNVVANYADKNDIKLIIDILDLWPDAYKMVFNIPVLSNLIFKPLEITANRVYKKANEIIAVSETYAKRALSVNRAVEKAHTVFIGTDIKYFDSCIKSTIAHPNEIWIAYIGMLGHSYDIKIVIDALDIINKRGHNNIIFIVMGDGPLKKEFEEYAKTNNVNAIFKGRLNYPDMVNLLVSCDIAINPIVKGASLSIINKHADYFSAGLPVISTQESEEFKSLLELSGAGFNCINGNSKDLAEKIIMLSTNQGLREEMSKNSRNLAEKKFNRFKTYEEIKQIVLRDN